MAALLSDPAGWLAVYLAVINLATFIVYGADKRRARKGKWRVPERTLFLLPLLGGSVGALLGMRVFHHKTRHCISCGASPPYCWRSSRWRCGC